MVVGFGISGQAAARFFLKAGAHVAVTDAGWPGAPVDPAIECHFGGHPPDIFRHRDLICLSPGVPGAGLPGDLPGLKLAKGLRIPITGEFGLAAEWVDRHWKTPMIAVTGTNGKSTTVTLIARMLEAAGKRVALAGNIGKPLMDVVMENKKPDWVVAEVSSYQLETVGRFRPFRPKISVLLNITEDHLDRYASFRDYARAKLRIFKEQGPRDWLLYNEEDPVVRIGIRNARAKKISFLKEEYPLSRAKLIGGHNRQNMMAAIATARIAGVPPRIIQKTLEAFEGLPHRTEFVREVGGVRYYDDSKGTNVDAVVKTLAGFPDRRVILIAGGRDKGGSYRPLKLMAARKVNLAVLIGEARDKIGQALGRSVETIKVERLEEAVPLAASRAASGDIVLLSPACSSFDQFRDYKERGEVFQGLVRDLKSS